jgi:GNAT superfamily N-acetyltransferase
MNNVTIERATCSKDVSDIEVLMREYLRWAADETEKQFSERLDVDELVEHSKQDMHLFLSESGRLLIVRVDEKIAGMGFLKGIKDGVCEIKRMYVRPGNRGLGLGRKMLQALISAAKEIGYSRILLDSEKYMHAAHDLYRSFGFTETDPYSETEMSPEYYQHLLFMKLEL